MTICSNFWPEARGPRQSWNDFRASPLVEPLAAHVDVDIQQLRNLVRAARKDAANAPEKPEAKRQGRAYRELFQFIKAAEAPAVEPAGDEAEDEANDE